MTRIYLIAFLTILRKEVGRIFRIWPQTLLPPAITMILYFVIFGHLIGARVGEMEGFPYMQYIAPGLIMMSVITNAYANVSSSFFSAKFQRSIEEMLVAPVPESLMLLGYVSGGVTRGVLNGLIVAGIALFFTHLQVQHIGLMLVVVLLCAILFSLAGMMNAIFAKKFDDVAIVPTFILTPLTYLGGVFYSLSLLPPFWHTVSLFNPVVYLVNTFRYALLGVSDISIWAALIAILFAVLLLFGANLVLLKKGVGIRH